MPNRYCRDELIKIALNMAYLPNLEIHDMPNGVVAQDAFSIQWLQDILDFWYHMVPFSASVTTVSLNTVANQGYVTLPTDFILDVRNGYVVRTVPDDPFSYRRVHRLPLQKFLTRTLAWQNSTDVLWPKHYCIQGVSATGQQLMKLTPTPTTGTQGTLWYYQLPPLLATDDIPRFPNDYVCIEYIRIRALEWARVFEPGIAQKFCDKVVAGMKAAGLMNEPEDDEVPFDTMVYSKGGYGVRSYGWMGGA